MIFSAHGNNNAASTNCIPTFTKQENSEDENSTLTKLKLLNKLPKQANNENFMR